MTIAAVPAVAEAAAGGAAADTAASRAAASRAGATRAPATGTSTRSQPSPAPSGLRLGPPSTRGARSLLGAAGDTKVAHVGGGVVLAVLLWTQVFLPFLQGGPTAVVNVWRAKWLNKGSDGAWLP